MMCPNMCYAINSNKAIYCYKCGYKFTDEDRYGLVKLIQSSASLPSSDDTAEMEE